MCDFATFMSRGRSDPNTRPRTWPTVHSFGSELGSELAFCGGRCPETRSAPKDCAAGDCQDDRWPDARWPAGWTRGRRSARRCGPRPLAGRGHLDGTLESDRCRLAAAVGSRATAAAGRAVAAASLIGERDVGEGHDGLAPEHPLEVLAGRRA